MADPYQPLPPIKGTRVRFESSAPFTPILVQQKLSQSRHNAEEYYENRVKNRTLNLERSTLRASRAAQLAAEREAHREKLAQRRSRHNVKLGMSMPQVKGLWTLNPEDARWDVFLPLHHLWLGYIAELLSLPARPTSAPTAHALPPTADMQAKLVKADFHGCLLSVRKAKNPFLVGRGGIVVHETENTFKVVTRKNKLKVIPKRHSIFSFSVPLYGPPVSGTSDIEEPGPQIQFDLYGNQFCYRASDRASRKFKHRETVEL